MRLADQTSQLIEDALVADQGNEYRRHLKKFMLEADDPFRTDDGGFRSHLGASMIGRDCPRALWYNFRWVKVPKFGGRIIRLFNRGHLEEPRLLALFAMIGVKIWQVGEDGKQFRISDHYGHFGSATDGVGMGIPELGIDVPFVFEFKTSSTKYFKKIKDYGVESEKQEHVAQMQIYMEKLNLKYALYVVANKDDDSLHIEILEYNPDIARKYIERAGHIIFAEAPPDKIHQSSSWYQCKFCDFSDVCHYGAPHCETCRTCRAAHPNEQGTWTCRANAWEMKKDVQEALCDKYATII